MNKEKTAWAVCLVLISLLAIQLPGAMPPRDEDYGFVRTLVDIQRQVASRYVEETDPAKLRKSAIRGMLRELDPYSDYIAADEQKAFDQMLDGQFEGVGIHLSQRDDGTIEIITPIDDSPAFKAGVMAGDVLLKINGQSIADKRVEEISKMVQGKVGTEVTLRVRRGKDKELDLTMTRQKIVMPTVKGYQRNGDNTWDYFVDHNDKIAYIRITQFTGDTYEKFKAVVDKLMASGMKGLILDLRFNPGGRLESATQIVDLFVDQGVIVSTRGRGRPEETIFANAAGTLPKFPLIVLVNGSSASAAEIVSGSLKDNHRALVIGSRTFGKGSVQELMKLDGDGGGELKLTVAYYYLPSGRLVHRKKDATDWGVLPQIQVNIDPAVEQKILRERYEMDLFHKPGTGPASAPATAPYGSDVQLQRAVDSMMAMLILRPSAPTSAPTTLPADDAGNVQTIPLGE